MMVSLLPICLCLLQPAITQRSPFKKRSLNLKSPSPTQKVPGPTIEAIEIRGAVRSAQSSLLALIVSRVGSATRGRILCGAIPRRSTTPGASPRSLGKRSRVPQERG